MQLEQEKVEEREKPSSSLQAPKSKGMSLVLRRVGKATNALISRNSAPPVPIDPYRPQIELEPQPKSRPYLWTFLLLVLLPSIAASFYFIFIASNEYQSQARFTVRSASEDILESGQEALKSAVSAMPSANNAAQNGYVVTNYIKSRAIIDDIGPHQNLKNYFARPEADFISRLPPDASVDALVDYWDRMVNASIDPMSGIVTLKVTAFRPEDALKLNQIIIDQSEKLVNDISDRARRDATKSAEAEVKSAFTNLQASLRALQDFRNKDAVIDPTQSNTEIATLLMPLLTEQLKLKNDEAVMSADMAEDAPSLRALRSRVSSLQSQIDALRGRLTGADSKTVSSALARFESLDVERLLNERTYSRAQANLDRAEARARRQTVYLSVFVPPVLPEFPEFPNRIGYSLIFFGALLILWGIGALIYSSVEDHRMV